MNKTVYTKQVRLCLHNYNIKSAHASICKWNYLIFFLKLSVIITLLPTTSSRLTAWPFCGLTGSGFWGMALSLAAPSSPLFNMPLQFPVPPSGGSLTEPLWEPLAAACREGDGGEDGWGIPLKDLKGLEIHHVHRKSGKEVKSTKLCIDIRKCMLIFKTSLLSNMP